MKPFLNNHICVVTGGTQGIGWAIVQTLADHGGKVYACGYSEENLQKAVAELETLPWKEQIFLSQCDVTNREQYEAWLTEIYEENGRIDILINNAAFVRWADILTLSVEEELRSMEVGYNAIVYGTNLVLPWMFKNGRGHFVNIGSIAGRVFVGGSSAAYGATKAAIDGYTQALDFELKNTPVNTTLVRLGTVAGTDFLSKHVSNERMPPFTKFLPALTPPKVAAAILKAIYKKKAIITRPRYLEALTFIYNLSPRFSRWLSYQGGENKVEYGKVLWEYKSKD